MKRSLFAVLLCFVAFAGKAEVVTAVQAERAACRFFENGNAAMSRSVAPKLKLVMKGIGKSTRSASAGAPAFYVFNRGNSQGFVIISGDDAVRPVLGYSYKGFFGVENMPENLTGYFRHLQREITAVRKLNLKPASEVTRAWNRMAGTQPAVQLVTPEWDQENPYNLKCPDLGGWHFYTGCTITATSIIMGYHQWPDAGVGELRGYTSGGSMVEVPGVTLGHPYLWNLMPYINGNDLDAGNALQDEAVATLMRDVGVMLRAQYDYDGTSAMISTAALKLPRHMKYHKGIMHLTRKSFSEQVWQQLLREEIDAGRPVLYAGYNTGSGHSFVLDGYDNRGCFSVNWGWGGRSNGYYDLRSLLPGIQGPGSSEGGYSTAQEAVMRIQPDRPDSEIGYFEKLVFTISSVAGSTAGRGLQITDKNRNIAQGQTIEVSAGAFANLGSDAFVGHLKLAVTDKSGNIRKVIHTTPGERNMDPGSITLPLDELRDFCTFTLEDPIAPGDRIRLLYPSKNGKWKPVTTDESDVQWEIVLKDDVSPMKIELNTTAGNNLKNRALATFSAEVPTTPSITGVEAFYAVLQNGNSVMLNRIEPENGKLVIPAHTGVVLSTTRAATFSMLPTDSKADNVPSSNLLLPSGADGITPGISENAYVMALENGDMLFRVLGEDHRTVAANNAYMVLPDTVTAESLKIGFDDKVIGIEDILTGNEEHSPVYDLSGRRVNRIYKGGIYIRKGKKFIGK